MPATPLSPGLLLHGHKRVPLGVTEDLLFHLSAPPADLADTPAEAQCGGRLGSGPGGTKVQSAEQTWMHTAQGPRAGPATLAVQPVIHACLVTSAEGAPFSLIFDFD